MQNLISTVVQNVFHSQTLLETKTLIDLKHSEIVSVANVITSKLIEDLYNLIL